MLRALGPAQAGHEAQTTTEEDDRVIFALLALSLAQPPVFVEAVADPSDQSARVFRDQLMLRLLEEGYPLVPSAEHATRTLRVEPTPGGMRVEAHGEDMASFEVATGPVLPLEAVHRAMEALEEVTPKAAANVPPPRRFAVHVEDAPSSMTADGVREALVHEVLARNAAVVPLDDAPDSVLCAQSLGDDIALSRGDTIGECGLQPAVVGLDNAAFNPTDIDRSLTTLMQEPEAIDIQPRDNDKSTVPRPTVGPTLVTDDTPSRAPEGLALRIGVRTGVYGRISAADAAVGTTLRVGTEPSGPGGVLDIVMVPSSAPDISVFETSISGGFGWMWSVHPVVALHVHGLAGLQIHRFRQRTQDAGHRFDWTVEVPVGASLRLAPRLRLDLTVRGGRTGSAREHRVEDEITWQRNEWRVGAAVGLSYGWSPQ